MEEHRKLAGPKTSHPATEKPEAPSLLGGAFGESVERCVFVEDGCDGRNRGLSEDENRCYNFQFLL